MNRRDFLKLTGASVASLSAAQAALAGRSDR
ncbi:MAG: twin-arginine translocation signal domain-containing protein, partial [Planctomycetota bacterium]